MHANKTSSNILMITSHSSFKYAKTEQSWEFPYDTSHGIIPLSNSSEVLYVTIFKQLHVRAYSYWKLHIMTIFSHAVSNITLFV